MLSLKRSLDEKYARLNNKAHQDYHRETWEDELKEKDQSIQWRDEEIAYLNRQWEYCQVDCKALETLYDSLEQRLAEKEAEIARLQSLLDAMSKKKK